MIKRFKSYFERRKIIGDLRFQYAANAAEWSAKADNLLDTTTKLANTAVLIATEVIDLRERHAALKVIRDLTSVKRMEIQELKRDYNSMQRDLVKQLRDLNYGKITVGERFLRWIRTKDQIRNIRDDLDTKLSLGIITKGSLEEAGMLTTIIALRRVTFWSTLFHEHPQKHQEVGSR